MTWSTRIQRLREHIAECREYCELEHLWTRYRFLQMHMTLRERDEIVCDLERKAIGLEMAEYIEREEAVQWLAFGLYLGSEEMRSQIQAESFDSHIRMLVESVRERAWGQEQEHNIAVLLGVIRKEKERLTDAIIRTLREDAEARQASGKQVGFGGRRWERLMRLRERRQAAGVEGT